MPERNTPYHAPWAEALQHRADPNRVSQLPIPAPGLLRPAAASLPSRPDEANPPMPLLASPQPPRSEPSYYDISLLKAPVWKWQIASYFFFGGVSAGAYLLSRVAGHLGGRRYEPVERAGTWVAMVMMLPCPPLLIHDLGDPKRFHHMLRVFKPSSPMNLGTFTLTAYGGVVTAALLRQLLTATGGCETRQNIGSTATRVWWTVHDTAGIPLAILVAGYTGVLLSCTANPLWCKNAWLGPMFSASAISTGAEAVRLLLDCRGQSYDLDDGRDDVLQKIDTAAHLAEAACLVGYTRSAGEKARPLHQGSMRTVHQMAVGALVASEVVKHLPLPPRWRKPARMLAAAAGLVSGFAMRWSIVHGGQEAANDPHLARLASRPESSSPSAGVPHQGTAEGDRHGGDDSSPLSGRQPHSTNHPEQQR